MIARLLRWLWVAALVGTAAAVWLSIHLFADRVGPWAAALGALVAVAAVHPAAIGCQFLMSRLAADPVPPGQRLSTGRALQCYAAEVVAVMRGVWIGNPFRAHRPAPSPSPGAHRDVALLFIHGYFCNRSAWLAFMREAAGRGYRCEAITLDDTFASIATHAEAVRRAIDALRAASGARRIVIVAHSMGGLVVRHALGAQDLARVTRVFTLGTPHRGTHAARFGRHASVIEMRRDSAWLRAAAERDRRGAYPRARYTAVFSWHDDIVYPQSTGALEGAECVDVAGVGHVALLYDARIRSIVFARLERGEEDVVQATAS